MKISLIIVTYERPRELKLAVDSILIQTYKPHEIVIVDNSETDNVKKIIPLLLTKLKGKEVKLNYYKSKVNLGVAGGRNKGAELSKGNLLIFLDDDAILATKDFIEKVLKRFSDDKSLGIAAVKSIDYKTGQIRAWELPLRNKKEHDLTVEVSYFTGVAHAIRKELFEKLGGYFVYSKYGAEELDLSYRVMETSYKIMYFPDLVVKHMKSEKGRAPLIVNLSNMIKARITISICYFPLWLAVINTIGYLTLIVYKYKVFSFSFIKAAFLPWKSLLKGNIKRLPLSKRALKKIKALKGRILF